jgi:dipeptidyl aminopeptidase/acylaminoacyl peptidase
MMRFSNPTCTTGRKAPNMKKVLKVIKWVLLSIIGLAGIVVVVFLILGVPKPGTLTTRNVPKIGIGSALAILPPPSAPNYSIFVGFDNDQNLLFRKSYGSYMADAETDSVSVFPGMLPYAAYGSSALRLKDGTFLYLNEKNTAEDRDLLKINIQTGETDTLFAGNSSVTSFDISPDNSIVLVYNEDHETSVNTLYKISLNDGRAPKALCTFQGLVAVQGFDAQMENAYVLQSFSEQDGKLYRVNLETGVAELEFQEEGLSKFFHGTQFTWYARHQRFLQTKNDSIAYYVRTGTSGLSKEFSVIWEYNKNSKTLTQRSPELKGDIGHIALTADERYLVYYYMNKGYGKLLAYDRIEKKNITLYDDNENPVFEIFNNHPFIVHPVKNKAYFLKYSLNRVELCVLDLDSASFKVIDPDPSAPVNPEIVFEEFTYATTDSTIGVMSGIHSFIYKPKQTETKRLPVLIMFHGGPDTYDVPHNMLAAQMVQNKFAVITPNYRGSAGYGVTFEKADDQYKRGKQIEDVKALVDWIETRGDLDHEKIILMGSSWGGFMTMASLAKYPDLFLGGISLNGATADPDEQRKDGLLVGWDLTEIGDKNDPEVNAALRQVSPVTNAQYITRPLFMYQGAMDARVSVESARKIVKTIEENKGTVWYVEASNSGHTSASNGPLEAIYLFSAMEQFMNKLIEE